MLLILVCNGVTGKFKSQTNTQIVKVFNYVIFNPDHHYTQMATELGFTSFFTFYSQSRDNFVGDSKAQSSTP
jgi:hypothetical protein